MGSLRPFTSTQVQYGPLHIAHVGFWSVYGFMVFVDGSHNRVSCGDISGKKLHWGSMRPPLRIAWLKFEGSAIWQTHICMSGRNNC